MYSLKISVIVPSYKPQDYLRECLQALDSQTLNKNQYEVIVILNGCDEPYKQFVVDIISSLKCNVRLIHTLQGGVSNARNIGIDNAKGEYLFFQDDDDYISENYLEEMLKIASPDIISISNTIAFKDKTKEVVQTYRQTKWYKVFSPAGKQNYQHIRGYFSGPWMKLIHRDIIADRRYDIRFKNGEDGLFNFLISNKFRYVDFSKDDVIYYRRYRESSAISNLRFNKKILINTIQVMNKYSKIYFTGKGYSFRFYLTRMLSGIHTIVNMLK